MIITALLLILFIVILISISWNTIYFGIGPTPTSPKVKSALFQFLPTNFEGTLYELGAGFGSLTFSLAKKYPKAEVIAIEGSLFPFLFLKLRALFYSLPNLKIIKKNFLSLPLKKDALLICYLAPSIMQKIENKLQQEGFRGILYTHTFALPDHKEDEVIYANDIYRTPIYRYSLDYI